MEDNTVPDHEQTASRSLQACQRCRSLKARCLPSPEDGTCQRCFKSKRECVWPTNQPKVRKGRGPSRIIQVEQKIDGLINRIADQKITSKAPAAEQSFAKAVSPETRSRQKSSASLGPGLNTNREDGTNTEENERPVRDLEEITEMHKFHSTSKDAPEHNSAPPSKQSLAYDDHSLLALIAGPEASTLFEEYRLTSTSFPFVPIATDVKVEELRVKKPLLLLAIMTVTAWKDRHFQLSLEKQLRYEIATRTFVHPKKDLVLLQSILIYISWYHYFGDHSFRNVYTYLQLCIGLAKDLRIEPRARPHVFPGYNYRQSVDAKDATREEQRAFLACYYLSSMISNGLQCANSFTHSSYMDDCCQRLETDQEFESDRTISLLISARKIEDQMHDECESEDFQRLILSDEEVLAQVEPWRARMDGWDLSARAAKSSMLLKLSHSAMEMEYHSKVLLRTLQPSGGFQSDPTVPSPTRLNIISACLQASKSFLDTLMEVTVEEFPLVSFVEWMRLPRIIMTIAMISVPSEKFAPDSMVKAAQNSVRIDLYLESLCYRMQSLTTFKPPTQPQPDFWMAMKMIMQSVRGWYRKRIEASKAEASISGPSLDKTLRPNLHRFNLSSGVLEGAATTSPRRPPSNMFPHPPFPTPTSMHMHTPGSGMHPHNFGVSEMPSHQFPIDMPPLMGMGVGMEMAMGMGMGMDMETDMNMDMDQFMNIDFFMSGSDPSNSMNF